MILDGKYEMPELLNFDAKIPGVSWENFIPVIVAGMSRDKTKVQEKLIEAMRGQKTPNLGIWYTELDNDVWHISIWDEASHDYILELSFKL